MQHSGFNRLMYIAVGLCLVGIGLGVTLSYIHAQIDSQPGYVSFCNVNDDVNCDRVLTSPFAKIAGIPIAWLSLAAYAGLAGLFFAATRSRGKQRQTALRLASLGVLGSLAFSIYMAVVSVFVIGSVCLMCSGLYVVALALTGVVIAASRSFKELSGGGQTLFPDGGLAASFVVSLVAVGIFAALAWPNSGAGVAEGATLAELEAADPEFYEWYTSQPVVRGELAAKLGKAPGGKVRIVEFSDFECGFCAKNHELLKGVLERMPSAVEVVYKHFPLDQACNDAVPREIHANACRAATASECARDQGRFDEMADLMFANQRALFGKMFEKLAGQAGLDIDTFAACMDADATGDVVVRDARLGNRLEIQSTPTLFINGRRIKGTLPSPEKYDHAVAIELRLAAGDSL